METVLAQRTYTEDGNRYVFRDIEADGERKTQYLVKEKWGEDMWTDCDPDADSDVAGARPYDKPDWPVDPLSKSADNLPTDEKPKSKKK